MASASIIKAQPTAKATSAERAAAERLGSVFSYLIGLGAVPLDNWAVPSKQTIGQTHGPLYATLGIIYGTDTERARVLAGTAYVNRYVLYKRDYDAVIPKVERSALAWTQSALTKEEVVLGTLRLKLENQSGLAERLKVAAQRVGLAAGGFEATRAEFSAAAPRREQRIPGLPVQQPYAFDPKNLKKVSKLVRKRVAEAIRKEEGEMREILSTLFAHPQGIKILRTYSINASAGTKLATGLVQEAQNATMAFRTELTDPDQGDHFWRYSTLVAEGMNELGLYDIQGFPEYAVSIGRVLSKSGLESAVNFASFAIVCLGVVFTGPAALLILGAGDLALAGTGAGLAYAREREQELGAQASALREESAKLTEDTDYAETALASAAALLSAIALFKSAREFEKLVTSRPKSINEVIAPKIEPATPAKDIGDPRALNRTAGKNAAQISDERGINNSVNAAEPEQKAEQRALQNNAKPEEDVVEARLTESHATEEQQGMRWNELDLEAPDAESSVFGGSPAEHLDMDHRTGMQLNEFNPDELSIETRTPGFGDASTEKGGTEHHTGMFYHEYSPAEVAIGLRIDWDPVAARPRMVTYNFTREAAEVPSQATSRSFHQEPRFKGESAQSAERAYLKSGEEKGHLAQREAGKVDPKLDATLGLSKPSGPEVERSLDVLTNVVPMKPALNKGTAWRSAERRTVQFAKQEGYVTVEITPIYDQAPKRLKDGTAIPSKFRRVIKSGPTGKVMEDLTFINK